MDPTFVSAGIMSSFKAEAGLWLEIVILQVTWSRLQELLNLRQVAWDFGGALFCI